MIKLRPHHLLCTLSYIGRGYCPAFVANMDRVCARLTAGEDALIVCGPDDICAPILDSKEDHCRNASVTERDTVAAKDLGIITGDSLYPRDHLQNWRTGFATGKSRRACTGCPWYDLCTDIAASGFQDTKFAQT